MSQTPITVDVRAAVYRPSGRATNSLFACLQLAAISFQVLLLSCSSALGQQGSSKEGGDSNDPSSPIRQMQFQDWVFPAYNGANGYGNLFLLRPVLPAASLGWFPSSITRPELGVTSTPEGRTGLGDLTIITVIFPVNQPHLRISFGPVAVLPTATNRYAGQGKWQLGPSALVAYTGIKGLILAALDENPISFAGESNRPDVNRSSLQLVGIESLPKGYYLREDPILVFDWNHGGAGAIPLNLALGRVFKIRSQPVNVYFQAEGTVHHPDYPGAVSPICTFRLSFTTLYTNKH